MKVAIVTSTVLGLSISAAMAECNYHNAQAAVPVEKGQTTGSIEPSLAESKQAYLIKQTDQRQSEPADISTE